MNIRHGVRFLETQIQINRGENTEGFQQIIDLLKCMKKECDLLKELNEDLILEMKEEGLRE